MQRLKKYELKDEAIIVCEEKNKKLSLKTNNNKFHKCKIDEDSKTNKNQNLKCDYILLKEDESIIIFIELKGLDIKHAFEQIEASYKNYCQGNNDTNKYLAIVHSNSPAYSTTIQKFKTKMTKQYKFKACFLHKIELNLECKSKEIIKIN